MQESPFYHIVLQRGITRGIEQGIEQGKAEGKAEEQKRLLAILDKLEEEGVDEKIIREIKSQTSKN